MSGIESWSTTPANNNQAPPFGWPAGILPSQVEPIGRQMMTSLAAWYQAAEWINYNFPIVYSSATVFTISTNATTLYHVGRRVQATDGSTSVFGTITASVFSSLTTVTVVWDSGVLQTGVTIVYVGITSKVNTSAPTQALTSAAFANPSASIGLAAVNGTATTAMASDSAPALSQSIAPTWTGNHIFRTASSTGTEGMKLDNSAGDARLGMYSAGTEYGILQAATNQLNLSAIGASTALKLSVNNGVSTQISAAGNVSIAAPSSGPTVTENVVAGATYGHSLSGVASNNVYYQATNGTQNGVFGISGANIVTAGSVSGTEFDLVTGGSVRQSISPSGNIVVNAPATGIAFASFGISNGFAGQFTGSSTAGQSRGLQVNAGTNASDFSFQVNNQANSITYLQVSGNGQFTLGYNGTTSVLSTSAAGNLTVAAPSSGTNLVLTQVSGQNAVTITDGTISQSWGNNGTLGYIGTNTAQSFELVTNAAARVVVSSAGNTTINAPSSGAALSVTGPANSRAVLFSGSSTSGQSFGMFINAGTTSADSAVTVQNQAQSLNYFSVRGDGVVFGNDGTNPFELGYKDVPLNNQAANYTAVLADRGKAIDATASITVTIPSAVFSAGHVLTVCVGSGATVTIAQGGGMTLQWVGNGATTGNRTLTGAGMASILFLTAAVALISGAGLT